MTHLLDRTRTAAGGVAGACVGGVSGRVVSEAAGMPPSRFGGIGIGIAYGLRGHALNPSWFVALPQQ